MDKNKMPIKDPNNINWFSVFLLSIMTLIGSISSYLYQLSNGRKFSFITLISQISIAILSGFLVYFIASHLSWSLELAGGVSGVAGWSGASLVKAIEKKLLREINK